VKIVFHKIVGYFFFYWTVLNKLDMLFVIYYKTRNLHFRFNLHLDCLDLSDNGVCIPMKCLSKIKGEKKNVENQR